MKPRKKDAAEVARIKITAGELRVGDVCHRVFSTPEKVIHIFPEEDPMFIEVNVQLQTWDGQKKRSNRKMAKTDVVCIDER